MLDLWNHISLAIFDTLLGWTLYLPSDVVLMVLALITGALMVITRPLATHQDMLARIANDRRRLGELIRQAKRNKDKEALARYRSTSGRLAMRKILAEFKPLLVVILPVALLATWAACRVEFHPPQEDEEIELVVFVQKTTIAADEFIHLVPEDGLTAINGWPQFIVKTPNEPGWWDRFLVWIHWSTPTPPEPDWTATWKIKGKAQKDPYVLKIPFREFTIERKLLIGQTTYTDAIVTSEEESSTTKSKVSITTQLKLRPVKLFGVVPELGEFLPAWLVGYIVIVVPLVFLLKWIFDIY